MSVFLQPIYTQTVGSGGAATVTFNNIPQTFTDLKIVMSVRSAVSTQDNFMMRFNGDTGFNYDNLLLYGGGVSAGSGEDVGQNRMNIGPGIAGNTFSANAFASIEVYIPGYSGGNYKTSISDFVTENNGATNYMSMNANLWVSNNPINSVTFYNLSGSNITQYSTFSLYGVLRAGI